MGKNCSVRQFCFERLPGPWAGSPPSDSFLLGLYGTHVRRWTREEMYDTIVHSTRIQSSEDWSISLSLSGGSASSGRTGKG